MIWDEHLELHQEHVQKRVNSFIMGHEPLAGAGPGARNCHLDHGMMG